jgi:acyl carrier protein
MTGKATSLADENGQSEPGSGNAASATGADAVERELLMLVSDNLLESPRGFDATSSLAAFGFDSMAIMQLLLLIEEHFGLWLPEGDLSRENLASVRSLAGVLARRLAERNGNR